MQVPWLMQKHSFSVVVKHPHDAANGPHGTPSPGPQPGTATVQGGFPQTDGYWAKAGVRRLDSTGADHATAAPAPIRLSILRREIRFWARSGSIDPHLPLV
jgi:hypothetical protein